MLPILVIIACSVIPSPVEEFETTYVDKVYLTHVYNGEGGHINSQYVFVRIDWNSNKQCYVNRIIAWRMADHKVSRLVMYEKCLYLWERQSVYRVKYGAFEELWLQYDLERHFREINGLDRLEGLHWLR